MTETLSLLNFISGTVVAALVNTAAVSVAAVFAAILVARGKGCSASTRYGLWSLILAFVIAAPFASIGMPPKHERTASVDRVSVISLPQSKSTVEIPANIPEPNVKVSPSTIFLLCWLIAATVQVVRVTRSFIHIGRLRRTAFPAEKTIEDLFEKLRVQSRIQRFATISISDRISSPVVIGYRRPAVLLPSDLASRLEPGELEQILLHELAHIARYDDWAIAVQRLIEAAWICQPLVWYIGRRLNIDREMACDDRVASVHEPKHYAACLAKIAETNFFAPGAAVLVPLMERKPELLARVEVLLDKTRTHLPSVSGLRLALAAALFIALGFAGLRAPTLMARPAYEPVSLNFRLNAMPAYVAEPSHAETPAQSKSNIYSIVVTPENGESTMFGDWSSTSTGESGREPGTIEFKSNNKTYVIRDKAMLAHAQQILRPMEELGKKQAELGEQQAKLGEQQAKLGEEQQKIADRELDTAAQTKLNQELQALKAKADEMSKTTAKTASTAQERLADLQAQLAEIQANMGEIQGKAGEEQGRLGELQGKLGEQQGQLGKRQGELGEQQAAEAKRAERKLKDLIRDAQSRGLATQLK